MKISFEAEISIEKFLRYLLIKRDYDDKSQFLKKGGFTIENYQDLINGYQFGYTQ